MKIDPRAYYCYLPGTLLEVLLEEAQIIDAVIDELKIEAHGKRSHLKTVEQKARAIAEEILHLQIAKGRGFMDVDPAETLAALVWRACGPTARQELFGSVKKEAELAKPVTAWLKEAGFTPATEVPMGMSRADVIGFQEKKGIGATVSAVFGGGVAAVAHIVAIELKNEYGQLKKALNQMSDYRDYAHEVYLACSPALAAEYLERSAKATNQWDPSALNRKLQDAGFGLLLVRGSDVEEVLSAKTGEPRKLKQFLEWLETSG